MSWIRIACVCLVMVVAQTVLGASDVAAQECDCCVHFEVYHFFDISQGNDCEGGSFQDDELVECGDFDGGCHVSSQPGYCYVHEACFSEQEDLDALAEAIAHEDANGAEEILSPWAADGRVTYVAERRLLLVESGCSTGYAAGFPLRSRGMQRAVRDLATMESIQD